MKRMRRLSALLLALILTLAPAAQALTVEQAKELLEEHYIDVLPPAAQESQSMEELLAALGDPYTQYFTAQEYADFLASMRDASLVGVGVSYYVTDEGGLVEQVFADGSAAKAGIVPGDLLLSADGVPLGGLTAEEARTLIAGEAGTSVTLKVRHADGKTESYTLTRAAFTVPATDVEVVDGHIGYITCSTFGGETYQHFEEVISQNDYGVDRWVVDLRGNGGGEVQATVDAVSAFTGGGKLAYVRDGAGDYYYYNADYSALTLDPVLVLVDEYTASASELFAGTIRDRQAGLVIGGRTYGKGVAQNLFDQTDYPDYFVDGDALKVTTYRAFSEGSVTNDQVGILPHLLVSSENAAPIAYLLSAPRPSGDASGVLRIHVGYWRLYLNLATAAEEYYHAPFVELLEALPPSVTLYAGQADGEWVETTVEEVASQHAPEYQPRASFSDLEGTPYEQEINTLATFGIVEGGSDGSFQPEDALDRATLCALLAKAFGYPPAEGATPFADVSSEDWYAPYVKALYNAGIISGYDDGLFHPDDPMNHEQFMIMLSRAAAWFSRQASDALQKGITSEALATGNYDAYDPWAVTHVWLMDGLYYDAAGNIDPFATTTRQEAAASLYYVLRWIGILVG